MTKNLLIDFGASRVKTALYDGKELSDVKDFEPVEPEICAFNRFEVSPEKLLLLFEKIKSGYKDFESVFISSEMHGFVLADESGNFLTNYVSWKDNRAVEQIEGVSTLDYVRKTLPDFRKKTGMNIKAGLPAVNFLHLLRKGEIKGKVKMMSLPEIFTNHLKENKIHITMLAGLGVWDIYQNKPYENFFDLCKSFGVELILNKPCADVEKIDEIHTAVGDNQCAMYGINLSENELCLNLGTGSQVVKVDKLDADFDMEQRPYLSGKNLSVITHIPSGRALNCYVGFVQEILDLTGAKLSAWDYLQEVTLEDLLKADLDFDLAVFESAYGYRQGGLIKNIGEKNLSLKNYFASLLKSYINQYISIIRKYDICCSKIVLSGGISRKLKVISQFLEHELKIDVEIKEGVDETLIGLAAISEGMNV